MPAVVHNRAKSAEGDDGGAGGRMVVLRLSDGSIWVHSPVDVDDDLAAALAELGEVKHIVTPNYEHTKFAQQVRAARFITYFS